VCAVDLAATGEREVPVESPLRPVSRRERLLLAAMRLFAQNGYQEATMADIGAAADVTGPNLYAYFENKADVLIAVVERGKNALWLDLGAALAAHSRPPDALEAVVAGTVRLSRNWSSLQAPAIGVPGVESVVKDMWRDYIAEWTGLLRASRPDLDPQRARVLVHAGLTVLDDLARTPHLTSDAAFDQNVALMVLAILYAAT
jgi:AcrR family transcriptional regulator